MSGWWFPLVLAGVIWASVRLGFFDVTRARGYCGLLLVGWLLWRLAATIVRVRRAMKIKLFLSFVWMIGLLSYGIMELQDNPRAGAEENKYIRIIVLLTWIPLGICIKQVCAEDAEVWRATRERRKAEEKAAAERTRG